MKVCPNDRCTRLHPDEYRGSCDLCGAACNVSRGPSMNPDEHLNMLRSQAGISSQTATRNMAPDPKLMEIAREGAAHALPEWLAKGSS